MLGERSSSAAVKAVYWGDRNIEVAVAIGVGCFECVALYPFAFLVSFAYRLFSSCNLLGSWTNYSERVEY